METRGLLVPKGVHCHSEGRLTRVLDFAKRILDFPFGPSGLQACCAHTQLSTLPGLSPANPQRPASSLPSPLQDFPTLKWEGGECAKPEAALDTGSCQTWELWKPAFPPTLLPHHHATCVSLDLRSKLQPSHCQTQINTSLGEPASLPAAWACCHGGPSRWRW